MIAPPPAQADLHADRAAMTPTDRPLLTVGIDVGGTKTACVVTDAHDRVLLHEVEPTQRGRLAGQLADLARRAVDTFASASSAGTVAAVGVAMPGYVEPHTGTATLAVNLGSQPSDAALGSVLEVSVGLPCFVEHDARAAATWLHARSDAGAAGADLAYLSVGTGISAGIILDGRVLRGANGLAGEVGHAVAEPGGAPCACGLGGCLEAVCAGPAIARLTHESEADGRPTILRADATAADVFRAAAEGDEVACGVATAVAEHLARAIRGLVLTLGIRHVVVGGGVAAAGEALLGPLIEAIGRERAASPLIEAAFARGTIELLSPQVEAGARGAAAIARQRLNAHQREEVGDR